MNSLQIILAKFRPPYRASLALFGPLVFLGASSLATVVHAAPVLSGDVEQIVSVNAGDCAGCTSSELDILERGVSMMLRELQKNAISSTAIDGPVCISQASFIKDLALVTFEAHRAGAISESRWRDSLRAKAKEAANLGDLTLEAMLSDYRDRLEGLIGGRAWPSSVEQAQTDLYASIRFSQIFEAMANGYWQSEWLPAMEKPVNGPNRVIEAVMNHRWAGRPVFDQLLAFSRPYELWREAELALLGDLRDDFLVGSVAWERDQLVAAYETAMAAEPWEVMGFGCGLSASEGFRRHARELSEGYDLVAPEDGGEPQPWIVVDVYPGPLTIVDVYHPLPEKDHVFIEDPSWPELLIEPRDVPQLDDSSFPGRTPRVPLDPPPPTTPVEPGDELLPGGPPLPYPGFPQPPAPSPLELLCGDQCPGEVAGLRPPPIHEWGSQESGSSSLGVICICQP